VSSLRLSNYSTPRDLIRLAFEITYLILLAFNMFIFVKHLRERSHKYEKWWRLEVQSLSTYEKEHRHRRRPEWIRKLNAVVTAYSFFDFIYFALSISAIIQWVSFNQAGAICKQEIARVNQSANSRDFYSDF
jgi:hypothetical protein